MNRKVVIGFVVLLVSVCLLTDATDWVRALSFNHNGTLLSVAGQEEKVWIYEVRSGGSTTTRVSLFALAAVFGSIITIVGG